MPRIQLSLAAFLMMFSVSAWAQPNYPRNPAEAKLVGTDLGNFVAAFNSLTEASDTVKVLQEMYFDQASPGLTEYIARFQLDAASITKAIGENPDEYRKIERFYHSIPELQTEFLAEMEAYKSVLPNAMFPPTYLLVADFKGIGQASKFGQLISVERKCVDDREALKNMIVHELTHFQQAIAMGIQNYGAMYAKPDNMLDMILREGGAEFITYQLVRKNPDDFLKLRWYEENELELWERFEQDLSNQDSDFWLTVSYDLSDKNRARQLGYGLGYKIVAAYYDKAEDKNRALQDILNLTDAQAFFAAAAYAPN